METLKNLLRKKSICFLFIAASVFIVYIQTIDAPFVLDDPRVVERDLKIRDISNFLEFKAVFGLRPLVNLSFAMNYWISGADVKIYHITNLIIHIANAILVYLLAGLAFSLARKKDAPDPNPDSVMRLAPFFAGALFALHPIQSQPVIYISQRATLMACSFYLLSVICYILARRLQIKKQKTYSHWLFFALCAICGLMAFLSKENAASIPLAILLVELMFFGNSWAGWKRKLPIIIGLAALMVFGIAWIAGAFHGELSSLLARIDRLTRETVNVSRWQYLCTQFTVILLYLRLILFPAGLNIDHDYPMKSGFFQDFTPFAAGLLLGIIVLSLIYSKKYKLLSFSVFWIFIALSVESSIIPIRDAMFEHRIYLAFPGVCIIFAFLLTQNDFGKDTVKILLFGVIILICALTTFSRSQVWESELSLWRDAAKKAPHNARAWNNYGNALLVRGSRQEAFSIYQQAIAANPAYSKSYCNLGKLYAEKGDMQKAEALFRQSIDLDPRFTEAHNNLAITYILKKEVQKGIEHFEKALQYDFSQPLTHYNLGKAYLLYSDQPDKAMKHLMLAISMKPDMEPMADYLVGAIWATRKNPEKAAIFVNQARRKGLADALEFVKKDPLFASCKDEVLAKLSDF